MLTPISLRSGVGTPVESTGLRKPESEPASTFSLAS
jgi:hypothetical protein